MPGPYGTLGDRPWRCSWCLKAMRRPGRKLDAGQWRALGAWRHGLQSLPLARCSWCKNNIHFFSPANSEVQERGCPFQIIASQGPWFWKMDPLVESYPPFAEPRGVVVIPQPNPPTKPNQGHHSQLREWTFVSSNSDVHQEMSLPNQSHG